jgi:2-polyprenyl-3-methyl-5-hydroxy-6-metoxy-1,4-benzoquinol methylase
VFLNRLLAIPGIHYFVRRFGSAKLRGMAFDGKYQRGDWNFHSDTRELPQIIQRYLNSGDLLILGCGSTSILADLDKSALKSVTGIDLSSEAIRLANRFASDRMSFRVSDMEAFESSSEYDVILFSESLYYVPLGRQLRLFRNLVRHLKSNGVFIVTLAEPERYSSILALIRTNYRLLEDRPFLGSTRHLIVFRFGDR